MDISDKRDFTRVRCIPFMSRSTPREVFLRFTLFLTLLGTNACQRNETASDSGPDSKAGTTATTGNNANQFQAGAKTQSDLEQSKKNAVSRFPDLGIADSEMNKAFLARVNHLKAINSTELNNPNWPYLVAVDVNAELDQEKRRKQIAEEDRKRNDRIQKTVIPILSTSDVLEQKTLPSTDIMLLGIVTKVESNLSNKLHGSIVLDGKIKCEFEYSLVNNAAINGTEITKRGDTLFRISKGSTTGIAAGEFSLYHVGQRVQITGRFQKKGAGVAVFRFEPPGSGVGLYSGPSLPY
jgi:hypothetical protein